MDNRRHHRVLRRLEQKPVSTPVPMKDETKKTTPQREWHIRKVHEQCGFSCELAERMVDEFSG
ncbi:hypothetical protein ACFL2Q_02100 [Thermodesulfobacteriota bacterium]